MNYIEEIKRLIDVIEKEETTTMETVSSMLADAIFNKRSVFVFGASHAGILAEEMYYRAGGLMVMNAIFGREMMLDISPITHTSQMERLEGYGTTLMKDVNIKDGDLIFVHSVSGRNCVSIEVAMEAKKKGAKVVCITNVEYSKSVTSRHSSGLRLFEVSDVVLDNHGDVGDACVKIEGLDQKVSPSSTVIGALMLNNIVAEAVKKLVEMGLEKPPIFYSANLDHGDDLNKKLHAEYKDQIHYKF